jgi:hypothetical protein
MTHAGCTWLRWEMARNYKAQISTQYVQTFTPARGRNFGSRSAVIPTIGHSQRTVLVRYARCNNARVDLYPKVRPITGITDRLNSNGYKSVTSSTSTIHWSSDSKAHMIGWCKVTSSTSTIHWSSDSKAHGLVQSQSLHQHQPFTGPLTARPTWLVGAESLHQHQPFTGPLTARPTWLVSAKSLHQHQPFTGRLTARPTWMVGAESLHNHLHWSSWQQKAHMVGAKSLPHINQS